ncbi:MAG: hypothetical protein M3P08_15285 [Thermoproteota archaeon]|nr:hypothetical protein [Thermoproteota archaeon]
MSISENSQQDSTEVLYGVESAVRKGVQFMQNTNKWMDLYGDENGPSIIIEFPDIYKNNYIEARRRGAKIRFITEITKENMHYCKELIKIVDEFRHLEGFKGGIAVSESEYMTTTTLRQSEILTQVFYSNVKEVVEQGQYVFDTFWKKAVPAEQKIREIEEGIVPDFIEPIKDANEVQSLQLKLVSSANDEILIIFPTVNTFRYYQEVGFIRSILDGLNKNPSMKVNILTAKDTNVIDIVDRLLRQHSLHNLDIKYIVQPAEATVLTLVVDRKFSLSVEVKEQGNSQETIMGLATYSNSKSTVLSYASIFESLWRQDELYEQLRHSTEDLGEMKRYLNQVLREVKGSK